MKGNEKGPIAINIFFIHTLPNKRFWGYQIPHGVLIRIFL